MPQVENGPQALNDLLETVYTECMKDGDEEKCSRIARGAAENAGWHKSGEEWVKAQELKSVELLYEGEFRPSNWGGKSWSVNGSMLDGIVAATEKYITDTNETPYIKLSHDSEVHESAKKFLGEMSLGKLARLYTTMTEKGKTLVADFTGVPDKMMKLIREGLASKRSVEVRTRPQYGQVLDAVAFFGAGSPAVKGLNDLANSLASCEDSSPSGSEIEVLCYDFDSEEIEKKEVKEMDEAKLKELQDRIAALESENETLKAESAKLTEYDGKIEEMQKTLEQREIELAEYRSKQEEAKKEARVAFVEGLVNDGKLIPAVKDEVATFCKEADDETFGKLSAILEKLPVDKRFEEKVPSINVQLKEGMSNEEKIAAWCKANGKDCKKMADYKEAYQALKLED